MRHIYNRQIFFIAISRIFGFKVGKKCLYEQKKLLAKNQFNLNIRKTRLKIAKGSCKKLTDEKVIQNGVFDYYYSVRKFAIFQEN